MEDLLLPLPRSFEYRGGRTSVTNSGCRVDTCSSERVRRLVSNLDLGGYTFSCHTECVEFQAFPAYDDDYSYELVIDAPSIRLAAYSEWGAITGCSTLAQLSAYGSLPNCTIRDEPQYGWRGLLVDVSRHFMALDTLRSVIDLMHHFKMNVLHLHLTDDQAFRFPVATYPKLASSDHYSKQDLASLVEYASDRAIRVVPEIDMPGHVTSWLVAYPEWGTEIVDAASLSSFGPHAGCLDPSNEAAVQGAITILEEAIGVFPDKYVHIGGDEVDSTWWNRSERVDEWSAQRGLESFQDIQAYFTKRIVQELEDRGRKVIVWDEALHKALPSSVLVQAWRGMRARDVSVGSGFQTLVSSPYYLDLNYPVDLHYAYTPSMRENDWRSHDAKMLDRPELEHVKDGLKWHQSFGKFPSLPTKQRGTIVGGEACMWSELVADNLLLKRIWTRLPAIAERLWGTPSMSCVVDIYDRLEASLDRLTALRLPDVLACPPVHECSDLSPLFEMLEPVKWYSRTLAATGTESRVRNETVEVDDRPYNATTPLNRVVDRLPAESLSARKCRADVLAGRRLTGWIAGWREQNRNFDRACSEFPDLLELKEASQALCRLADVAEGILPADARLAGPFGEYLLPIAFAFCSRNDP